MKEVNNLGFLFGTEEKIPVLSGCLLFVLIEYCLYKLNSYVCLWYFALIAKNGVCFGLKIHLNKDRLYKGIDLYFDLHIDDMYCLKMVCIAMDEWALHLKWLQYESWVGMHL